jgi:hypothetical protein
VPSPQMQTFSVSSKGKPKRFLEINIKDVD